MVTNFAGNAIISVLFVEYVATLTLGLWFFVVNLPSLGRNFIRVAAQKDGAVSHQNTGGSA